MPGKITRLLFEKADRRRAGRRAMGSHSTLHARQWTSRVRQEWARLIPCVKRWLESHSSGHRSEQRNLVMRTGLLSEDDRKTAASLQTTDYHSTDEQVRLASWGREDLTTDSLRLSRPFDEVRLQSSPCPSASDNYIACEPDCRWTGKGYRGGSCRTDILEELEHL